MYLSLFIICFPDHFFTTKSSSLNDLILFFRVWMFFEEFSGDESTFSEVVDETTKSASRKVLV